MNVHDAGANRQEERDDCTHRNQIESRRDGALRVTSDHHAGPDRAEQLGGDLDGLLLLLD